jgi:hypothetical protein
MTMEPLYDLDGRMVGWLKSGVVYDMGLRPIGSTKDRRVFSNDGLSVGRIEPSLKDFECAAPLKDRPCWLLTRSADARR